MKKSRLKSEAEFNFKLDEAIRKYGSKVQKQVSLERKPLKQATDLMERLTGFPSGTALVTVYRMINMGFLKSAGWIDVPGGKTQSVISTGLEIPSAGPRVGLQRVYESKKPLSS